MINRLILEGNTGAGKTTLSNAIVAKGLGRKIPEYMEIVRADYVSCISTHPPYPIGLFCWIESYRQYIASQEAGLSIFDRSFLSVLGYAFAKENEEWRKLQEGSLPNAVFETPIKGHVLYLRCKTKVREARCKVRSGSTPSYYFSERFSERYDSFFDRLAKLGISSIDTTNLTLEETIAAVMDQKFSDSKLYVPDVVNAVSD